MDQDRFDHFTKQVAGVSRREITSRALSGLAALTFGLVDPSPTAAKPRRCGNEQCAGKCCTSRRNRKKKFCVPKAWTCCPAGNACRASTPKCCNAQGRGPRHPGYCARQNDVCCPWSAGGHVCSEEYPVCCRARPGFKYGLCARRGRVCCPVGAGTSCPATHPVCCPAAGANPKYCCTPGSICGVGDCFFGGPFSADSGDGQPADSGPAPTVLAVVTG